MDIKFIDTPKPIGNFANVRFSGKYAYISGQGAFDDNGKLITGKVGKDLNFEEAFKEAFAKRLLVHSITFPFAVVPFLVTTNSTIQ